MDKPTVRYTDAEVLPVVGWQAVVKPIDHPSELVSNTKMVVTSFVKRVGENGEFWTQNTHYVKEK